MMGSGRARAGVRCTGGSDIMPLSERYRKEALTTSMSLLLSTALALSAGLLMTRVFKYTLGRKGIMLPDVTAFLIAGIIVGPYALGKIGIGFSSASDLQAVNILSTIALGFIAFDIGSEFRAASLKEIGRPALIIGIFQAVTATVFVDAALILLSVKLGEDILPLPAAIILGAIASATAPAATLMVVRQFKAKGPLTDLLLPIVAIDDAVGLVIFAASMGIAQAMIGGTINFVSVVINPFTEIICSVILGSLMGYLLTLLEKLFFSNSNRLSMTISFVLMTIALSSREIHIGQLKIAFSSLLVCMTLGTVFCNMSEYSSDIMARSQSWSTPLYATFFTLSGSSLNLHTLNNTTSLIAGITYLISRSIGKYSGAFTSSSLTHQSHNTKYMLGLTLLPQAGVALGMSTQAQILMPEHISTIITNITLFSVLIYELAGPLITHWALQKAGEIQTKSPEHINRARFIKS